MSDCFFAGLGTVAVAVTVWGLTVWAPKRWNRPYMSPMSLDARALQLKPFRVTLTRRNRLRWFFGREPRQPW